MNFQRYSNAYSEERSGSVVESTEGSRVRASPVSLRCILEQDTLILANSSGSTQEDQFLHNWKIVDET